VGKKERFMAISGIFIAIGIVSMIMHGGLKTGIDFSGGTEVHVRFPKEVTADHLRAAVEKAKLGEPVVQQIGIASDNEYLVRVAASSDTSKSVATEIRQALDQAFGADTYKVLREDIVGPRAGRDLRMQGLYAVLLSFLGILIYVGIRFDFKFGVGAIVALVHDTLILLTLFSLLNKEISLTIIAAILTVIGYSMNDTVIVFDRVRENMRLVRTKSFAEVINLSVNETLSRTILTSTTVMLVSVVLFFLGGSVLHDFAFCLIVGVIAGTFSSIYIAAPIVIYMQKSKGAPVKKKR
jgi:preprotein translocase subunit SecF